MYIFFLSLCSLISHTVGAHEVFKKLDSRMVFNNSLVCVGLDPDRTQFPLSLMRFDQKIEQIAYQFLVEIIEITAPHACSFKLQKAFFDTFENGYDLLKNTIAYIHTHHPEMPVFIDCKIGDIDNTMKAYMQLIFDDLAADAVVVNPYMGDDVLKPFIQDPRKVAIILIKTSNPHAKTVQELSLANGKKLWQELLTLTVDRWNINKNMMIVLSSTPDVQTYATIRNQIPEDMPILLTGIGFQGGNPVILKQLLNGNKRGVFVNSSRAILYPYDPSDPGWKTAVLKAVIELKSTLNEIRLY